MKSNHPQKSIVDVLRDHLTDESPLLIVTDMQALDRSLVAIAEAFPPDTLHAVAVKANNQEPLMRRIAERGFGFEAASASELAMALGQVEAERVVYDAPAKTGTEISKALAAGVRLNVDSIQELRRVAACGPVGRVGVRINPGGRVGAAPGSSTAIPGSKFGIDLREDGEVLLSLLRESPFIDGLHVHTGSQGGDPTLLVDGARSLVDFAIQVEAAGKTVSVLDIGGGLSVDYRSAVDENTLGRWVSLLRTRVPELFSGRWRIITELGRAVHARHSVAVSRVEYTKRSGGRNIAITHAGADLFLRAVYQPELWYHRISVYDQHGQPKGGEPELWDVAGPLCFSGDLIGRGRLLPPIVPGDVVVVHDVGAYTLSMWSRYNERARPKELFVGDYSSPDDISALRSFMSGSKGPS